MAPTYTNDRTPNRRYGCSDTSKFLNLHTGKEKWKKEGREDKRRGRKEEESRSRGGVGWRRDERKREERGIRLGKE